MKRLTDEEQLSGEDEQLADLLRAAAPFESDPFRKRRVLVALERGRAAGRARFWLRPALIAALLVSGTAAAAIGHRYVTSPSFFGTSAVPSTSPMLPAPAAAAPPPASLRVEEPPLAQEPPLAEEPPLAQEPTLRVEGPPVAASAPKSAARAKPESGEDATRVVQAVQALRTGRDPARAQALLDEYLKAQPRGSLSGEALALSIEAASARNDPRAADYARRYLATFPNGKYRELAKRALHKP